MIEKKTVCQIVDEWLEGKDYFLVEVTIGPDDKIVVEIDHKEGVWIEDCVDLSRYIESRLSREQEDYELEVGSAGIGQPFKVLQQYLIHVGEEVEVLVWQRTDLGYKVIVDNQFGGMLFHNEIFQPVEIGMRMEAYVKQVREDGKIDLELQQSGMHKVEDFAGVLLRYIKDEGGYTPLNDKTDAEVIYQTFGVSKKTFKKAVGELYRKRLIVLEEGGMRLA